MIFLSQTEQAGGYWLIMVKLSSDKNLPFGYKITVDNQDWVLFSQTGKNASFLAHSNHLNNQPIIADKPKSARGTPPWHFLAEAEGFFNTNKTYLLLASDLDMAGAFHLLKELKNNYQFIVLFHATNNFPFIVKPAQIMFNQFPHEAIGSCPLLEDWKLVNRLCSDQGHAGCFDGNFDELFKIWTPPNNWEILRFE